MNHTPNGTPRNHADEIANVYAAMALEADYDNELDEGDHPAAAVWCVFFALITLAAMGLIALVLI